MMRLAFAYSSKDKVEQTEKTLGELLSSTSAGADFLWCDASTDEKAVGLFEGHRRYDWFYLERILGGADAAIAWKLTKALCSPNNYTHIMLLENDVMLHTDWFEPTMALFEKGAKDGLEVGAVSPRSYVDRVLIQRDGFAVMHNVGAGCIVFTREAAEIVLASFRTHWWPDNRKLFAQLSGLDLNTWIGFQEQLVTTDWGWEAQLARHGLATLALTPAKCLMPWEDVSVSTMLNLVTGPVEARCNDRAFDDYQANLAFIRQGRIKLDGPGIIQRFGSGMLLYPHQLGYLAGSMPWQGNLELQNSQAHGPFAYRVGPDGASLAVRISGTFSFLVGGGVSGARASIRDTRSGFSFDPALPAMNSFSELSVPGGPVSRIVTLDLSEGAVFYGIQTVDAQMLDESFRFDWSQLPKAT